MEYFLNLARHISEYNRFISFAEKRGGFPTMVTGLSHIQKAHWLSAFSQEGLAQPLLVLVESESVGAKLCEDINVLLGEKSNYRAMLFPAKDMVLTDIKASSKEYEYARLDVLTKLQNGQCPIVIASAEGALQHTIPREVLSSRMIRIKGGEDYAFDSLINNLISAGFYRCDMIEGPAQFSVRGSIVDIFPVNSTMPIRLEFWGDTIDSIAYFDIESQRRNELVDDISISPASEVLFESEDVLKDKLSSLSSQIRGKNTDKIKKLLLQDIEKLENKVSLSVYDKYLPLAYNSSQTIFDYVNSVIICEHVDFNDSVKNVVTQHNEDLKYLFQEGFLCKGLDDFQLSKSQLGEILDKKLIAYFDTFARGGNIELSEILSVSTVKTSPWSGEYKVLEEELRHYLSRGYSCVVFSGTQKGAMTLAQDLRDDGFPADYSDNPKKLIAKKIYITIGTISSGFEYPEEKCAVFTRAQITNISKKVKPKRKKAEQIRSLSDISVGDLVVHYSYGIGIFDGIVQIENQGILKDYIKIRYAGKDVLYVPVTQLDSISRYIGSQDASTIKLNKLNSDQWKKTKAKAKAAAVELAAELIELYSRRMKSRGFSFSEDDDFQEDFENHFSYIETDSQLKCIDEIKSDMQRDIPMERLLCGDVGFGKTEVALRAAFKCIHDGKQCALLVPTTVLAWQHFQTAMKRMEGFPINIELLSRFRTAKEKKQIVQKLREGKIDFIIGTHRLVQDDVVFKDLGLVIIDEEQRFGVAHKEKFKDSFSGVDVLTLSATPIPRTLNMAMSGIRDMSVLDEPPQDRQPITTYVIEHDWGMVVQAINKEIRRGGQVYYIHNRIESIIQCAAKIQEFLPDIGIAVAHGRMSEDQLLDVWKRLIEGEIQVLVCTTLIETGVDVPNVNTLIIENADNMGLAQLHQLRGRVGRTNKRAFAYFTFRRGKVLTEIATKRLDAIREFTQFGSGFRIALKDLEIRGAGSILGSSQSGHLANVGYDMYLKLLNEAVAEQKGEEISAQEECLVDIKIDAYIPESYIINQAQRIDCYRKIAMIKSKEDAMDVLDELIDRYGDIPKSVEGLVEIALIKNMAAQAGIEEIIQNENYIVFFIPKPDMKKIARLSPVFKKNFMLNMTERINVKIKLEKKQTPLSVLKQVVELLKKE